MALSVGSSLISILFFVLAMFAGLLLPVKAGCDINLKLFIGDPVKSATIVTCIGALFLTPTVFIKPRDEHCSLKQMCHKMSAKDRFVFLTGPFGSIQLIIGIIVASQIGFSLYFVCVVFGQILTSFAIDFYGLLWKQKKHFSCLNKLSIPLIVIAICIFQLNDYIAYNKELSVPIPLLLVYSLIAMIAGVLWVFCSVFNERLDEGFLGSPYRAQVLAYYLDAMSGCVLISITHFIDADILGGIKDESSISAQWWYFIGGAMGLSYVITLICIEHIGCSATYIGVVSGNLFMSLILDQIGAFGMQQHKMTWNRILGVALLIVSCIVINIQTADRDIVYRHARINQVDQSQSMMAESMRGGQQLQLETIEHNSLQHGVTSKVRCPTKI